MVTQTSVLCAGPTSIGEVLARTFRLRRGSPAPRQDRVKTVVKRNGWREWPRRYARMSHH
ncbi:MAG: hypothetical protein AAB447_03920 [Patescibacteria group bacterium]